ncbi:unnamed protein product [Darwinula stevensoni]|uniref:Kazal-like domain-containing protein n=1 Tax=Darwinula stevensoni TaxID=69355 RepID=A0A7R9A1Z6_9CRUS|nr:unnamed protein product [Darwinula stevensoni]CAG0884630.1 unnamed protein product [Darwinula stevensoni]
MATTSSYDNPSYVETENGDIGAGKKGKTAKDFDKYRLERLDTRDAEERPDPDTQCGVGACRPGFLQCCANIYGFGVLYCIISLIQGCYFTYFLATISTVEKRFGIQSRNMGFIMAGNEVSQIIFSLILNFYGGRGHRPRWISCGMFAVSLSCLFMALPHFILGPGEDAKELLAQARKSLVGNFSQDELQSASLCSANGTRLDASCEGNNNEAVVAGVLIFSGFFVAGVGLSVFYTLGLTYFDDHIRQHLTPVFISVTNAIRTVGPTLGFALGYVCLSLYVEPFEDPGVTKRDPRWIGSYWLGLFHVSFFRVVFMEGIELGSGEEGWILIGILLTVAAAALFFFPRRLELKEDKPGEADAEKVEGDFLSGPAIDSSPPKLKEMPETLGRILRNPLLMCHVTAITLHILGFIGFFSFSPKYLESQFRTSAANSSAFAGGAQAVVQCIGMVASGIVLWRFRPRARWVVGWNIMVGILYVAGMLFAMLIGCSNIYMHGRPNLDGSLSVESPCNVGCDCRTNKYLPVCSEDGAIHFYSPCFAGCTRVLNATGPQTVFGDCRCIVEAVEDLGNQTDWTGVYSLKRTVNGETDEDMFVRPASAIEGFCSESICSNVILYLGVIATIKLLSSTARTSSTLVAIRSGSTFSFESAKGSS